MLLNNLLTAKLIAANWTEVASNRVPALGAGLFPARKKAGLDLGWIVGAKGLPVSLMPSAFDAKATFRDRIGVKSIETEMPFFREGFLLKEKDRQEILRASENDPYVAAILAKVYDDANNLVEGADVVAERMRMQLLFPIGGEMQIVIKANGVDYSYDYDANDDWKGTNYTALSGTSVWTAPTTADPLKDIKTVKDAIRSNTGSEAVYLIMNGTTFNLLAATDAVKERIQFIGGLTPSFVTDAEVKRVIQGTSNVQIVVYDKMYKDESGVAHSYVPDNYVAFVPAGALGNTWYGTTPEEADLMGNPQADVALVNTGVAISTILQPHPVNITTLASEIVLPSYERMNEVGLLKVA